MIFLIKKRIFVFRVIRVGFWCLVYLFGGIYFIVGIENKVEGIFIFFGGYLNFFYIVFVMRSIYKIIIIVGFFV